VRTAQAEQAAYTWLTPREAAEQIGGVSVTHVMQLVSDREIRARNVARAGAKRPRWRIDPASVRAFNDRRTVGMAA
jgi:hypothetical protein